MKITDMLDQSRKIIGNYRALVNDAPQGEDDFHNYTTALLFAYLKLREKRFILQGETELKEAKALIDSIDPEFIQKAARDFVFEALKEDLPRLQAAYILAESIK